MSSTTAGETSPALMDTAVGRPRKPNATFPVLIAFFLLVLLAGIFAFRNVGYWLIRQDPLQKSDVIVVLSGGMPARAEESAQVFLRGYAPEIWVSRPDSMAPELEPLGVKYVGEDYYNHEIL